MSILKKYGKMDIAFMALLLLNVVFGIYIAFFKRDALWLETLKVWGNENMNLAVQLYESDTYKQQQSSTLQQILASMGQTDTATDTTATETPTDTTTAVAGDTAKFAAIQQNGYIMGNKNARITIIEYSDMLCPYCKRHYDAQTIENLIKKYPNDVNMVFRQMPLPQLHPTAPIWAQAAVCVGKLAGADKYYAFLAKWFATDEFTEDNVTEMAVSLGVNKAKFTSCLTSEETIATVNAEVAEAQSFGINGTPGNIVVDNTDGTYTLIAGAYPTETFEAEITKILAK